MKKILILLLSICYLTTGAQNQVIKRHEGKQKRATVVKPRKTSPKTHVQSSAFQYEYICNFSNGYARAKRNKKWGYIDKTGKEVIPCIFELVDDFNDGIAFVKQGGKWGIIDCDGKQIVPFKYDHVQSCGFNDGLAAVQFNGKWGFINKDGVGVIPCKFEFAGPFSEGLSKIKLNGEWGYIDKEGERIISSVSDDCNNMAPDFQDGLIAITKNQSSYFLDKTGKKLRLSLLIFTLSQLGKVVGAVAFGKNMVLSIKRDKKPSHLSTIRLENFMKD